MKRLSDGEIEELQAGVMKYHPGSNFSTLSYQNQIQIELSLRILDELKANRIEMGAYHATH